MDRRDDFPAIFPAALAFCAATILISLVWQGPAAVLAGLWAIVTSPCALTTDYFALAGPGAALVNAALVTLVSLLVLKGAVKTFNGSSLMVLGLMSGFSLFGQNIFNLWPILTGAFLYAKFRGEPFGKYAVTGLLGTALGPVVSFFAALDAPWALPAALGVGLFMGFVLPPLAGYVARFHNGMNLYNAGFACGLLALVMMPVLFAAGLDPAVTSVVTAAWHLRAAALLALLCLALLVWGLFFSGEPPLRALADFNALWRDSGRAGCDFLKSYGPAAVLVNTGLVGLMGTGYILLIGGTLNGPTVGAILVMMGFAGCGKHPRNITPIMLGVWLSTLLPGLSATSTGSQIAALFGTTLAPVAGCFGAPFGVLAGFLHGCVVLRTGAPVAGVNLYNNGFSGGLVAAVLYPILTGIFGKYLKGRDIESRYP